MESDSAHKKNWENAEVVFGIPFLVGIALYFVVPLSLDQGFLKPFLLPVGVFVIIAGIGIVTLARREFAQYGQPTDPGHPTSKIVKTGIFSISRNPLYLGGVLVLFGLALILNMLWVLIMLLVSTVLCHFILILPEEQYLAAKFGSEYDEYVASVQRWLGRK